MAGSIHIGVGGWTFEPWRGTFYPQGLAQKRELQYMGEHMTSVEINGTFYGSQKPESFQKWHDEVPENFVFSLKGSRFTTNRRVLAEAGESLSKFLSSGVTRLGKKLGPINWQLAGTKKFDPDDFAAFLKLLPHEMDGLRIRHAVEPRHESFCDPQAIALARENGVALITGCDSKFPVIADPTADFVYLRLMGTSPDNEKGYSDADLDAWAERLKIYAGGGVPSDLPSYGPAPEKKPRDVFAYVIAGAKEKNPAAAQALIRRI
ncbi:DUF72 domain-containing protein [Pelagibacterium limicola]|uniref:DUF72 domain-containing protein n=1 Tax=Pelagibacterium limicola TaxID=2791022 RepID=UPI0018AF9BC7|nr:DUF72 domain-containing protein [Pelagibacterium limicola]